MITGFVLQLRIPTLGYIRARDLMNVILNIVHLSGLPYPSQTQKIGIQGISALGMDTCV
jgi:hypothetical protein